MIVYDHTEKTSTASLARSKLEMSWTHCYYSKNTITVCDDVIS